MQVMNEHNPKPNEDMEAGEVLGGRVRAADIDVPEGSLAVLHPRREKQATYSV